MLTRFDVVLIHTRFPENIGMAARACANMGVQQLTLVSPERMDIEAARPLATRLGEPLLNSLRIVPDLASAVGHAVRVLGTTARLGGIRQHCLMPDTAARTYLPLLQEGHAIALVFGAEDKGLSNDDIMQCHDIITIPTADNAASLNVAQAVLLVLYAFRTACLNDHNNKEHTTETNVQQNHSKYGSARRINHEEYTLLMDTLKNTLVYLDHVQPDHPDIPLMAMRRFLAKADIRRHEMDMLMGVCRQIHNHCQ